LPLYKNTAGNMKINYTVITVGKTRILTILGSPVRPPDTR